MLTGTAYAPRPRPTDNCPHLDGWTHTAGESRCNRCGTRRFTDYRAVRPHGLPRTITPSARDGAAADRAAARNVAWNVATGTRWTRRRTGS
ncbi:DUF6255 family natural product biosynthesis protein [Streptomyces cinnamoneus]|uniref:DUF6255 family natural product biosynthesis protein n=1 Tax=Streptomyces cinnamoneus TaxID=53446 RepID=UPI0033C72050